MAQFSPSRRSFIASSLTIAGGLALAPSILAADSHLPDSVLAVNKSFGGDRGAVLDPALVQQFVRISHFDSDGVRQMLDEYPSLLNAGWDWGGGDFETGLGAASHVGNRDIALHFISKGARMNLFAATMLGHLEIVKGFLGLYPKLIEAKGPHGLSLLHHAKKGGEPATGVLAFLEGLHG